MPRLAPRRRATTVISAVCAVAGLIALGYIGLSYRAPQTAVDGPLFRFLRWAQQTPGYDWITYGVVESTANVLLFVPVGAVAFLLLPRRLWPVSLLVGPALSVAIEVSQALLRPGRVATFDDIVANSLGAAIGWVLAVALSMPFAARAAPPVRLH